MAANVEKQQGHRAGAYKQKNKVHKHGKHRTKGEIERENKGKLSKVLHSILCRYQVPEVCDSKTRVESLMHYNVA